MHVTACDDVFFQQSRQTSLYGTYRGKVIFPDKLPACGLCATLSQINFYPLTSKASLQICKRLFKLFFEPLWWVVFNPMNVALFNVQSYDMPVIGIAVNEG